MVPSWIRSLLLFHEDTYFNVSKWPFALGGGRCRTGQKVEDGERRCEWTPHPCRGPGVWLQAEGKAAAPWPLFYPGHSCLASDWKRKENVLALTGLEMSSGVCVSGRSTVRGTPMHIMSCVEKIPFAVFLIYNDWGTYTGKRSFFWCRVPRFKKNGLQII